MLSKEQVAGLKVGQALLLRTAPSETFLNAKVVVTFLGSSACRVKVVEIIDRAPGNMTMDEDIIVASFGELSIPPE